MVYSEEDFFTNAHGKINGKRACIVKHKNTGEAFIVFEKAQEETTYRYDSFTPAPGDSEYRKVVEACAEKFFHP